MASSKLFVLYKFINLIDHSMQTLPLADYELEIIKTYDHHRDMEISIFICFFVFLLFGEGFARRNSSAEISTFDQNYYITWGNDHVEFLNQGSELQLSMDKSSGSGFGSKLHYGSGFFHIQLQLPNKDSAGVVTAFYLTSQGDKHDELDFEFLGNREGKPITLQTNVFANGVGNREQRIHLWFDPTDDFHTYKILWNPHQIVFYVDDIPIRIFNNNERSGVGYPSKPMQIEASLWNGEIWATDGGQTKINWTYAPFKAHFRGFDIKACPADHIDDIQQCYSSDHYWWNSEKFWKLDSAQQRKYDDVRNNFMYYDYCSDKSRYPNPPKECLIE